MIYRIQGKPAQKLLYQALALAAAIEIVTAFFRFGLDLQSMRDTGIIAALTFGLRIHHGYLGVVVLGLASISWLPAT